MLLIFFLIKSFNFYFHLIYEKFIEIILLTDINELGIN